MISDGVLVGALVATEVGVAAAMGRFVGVAEAGGVVVGVGIGVGTFVGAGAAVGTFVGVNVAACVAVGAGVGVAPQAAKIKLALTAHRLKDSRRITLAGMSRAIKGVSVQVMKNMIHLQINQLPVRWAHNRG